MAEHIHAVLHAGASHALHHACHGVLAAHHGPAPHHGSAAPRSAAHHRIGTRAAGTTTHGSHPAHPRAAHAAHATHATLHPLHLLELQLQLLQLGRAAGFLLSLFHFLFVFLASLLRVAGHQHGYLNAISAFEGRVKLGDVGIEKVCAEIVCLQHDGQAPFAVFRGAGVKELPIRTKGENPLRHLCGTGGSLDLRVQVAEVTVRAGSVDFLLAALGEGRQLFGISPRARPGHDVLDHEHDQERHDPDTDPQADFLALLDEELFEIHIFHVLESHDRNSSTE